MLGHAGGAVQHGAARQSKPHSSGGAVDTLWKVDRSLHVALPAVEVASLEDGSDND